LVDVGSRVEDLVRDGVHAAAAAPSSFGEPLVKFLRNSE
jgi:hypothetical protein